MPVALSPLIPVTLSGAETSRSEVHAESKGPYPGRECLHGNSPFSAADEVVVFDRRFSAGSGMVRSVGVGSVKVGSIETWFVSGHRFSDAEILPPQPPVKGRCCDLDFFRSLFSP